MSSPAGHQVSAIPPWFPYRSAAAQDHCLTYLDALAIVHWPVQGEQRYIPTRFGPTFARVAGPPEAPPLVLLHGAATTSLMWAPNVAALSSEYRTIALDQIQEFGRSRCTRMLLQYEDLLDWLSDVFDGLELESSTSIMGISYGGALAARFALAHPSRVSRTVLIAPAATVLGISIPLAARLFFAAVSPRRWLRPLLRWIFPDASRQMPQWIEETLDLLLTNMTNMQRHKILLPKVWPDADWERLSVPTLFLVGEHEVIYSPAKALARLRRVAPAVTAEMVSGAGHDLTFVQADSVNRRVIEFLRQPVD